MFDFQKLEVYQKARKINANVQKYIKDHPDLPPRLKDQLSRASLSVMLNIAEGAGRFSKADKQHFYVQSRSSVFETVACLEAYFDLDEIKMDLLNDFEKEYEDISKMLFSLINK